jgi:hypothetical protein
VEAEEPFGTATVPQGWVEGREHAHARGSIRQRRCMVEYSLRGEAPTP